MSTTRGLSILLLLGCAQGKTPPPVTISIPIDTDGKTFTFGEEVLCTSTKVGDSNCENQKPPESGPTMQVKLSKFAIDAHEVTNLQYQHCVALGNCSDPRAEILLLPDGNQVRYYDEESTAHAQSPVVNVTWAQARQYCQSIGKRLPTEAEWEIAARQDATKQVYPWGDDPAACKPTGPSKSGKKVGIKGCDETLTLPKAVTGVFDDDEIAIGKFTLSGMAGNVSEWVEDAHDPDLTCGAPITELKTSTGGQCKNAYRTECDAKPDNQFAACAAPFEACQACRDEADETAPVDPKCYGQCLASAKPVWVCQRKTETETDPEGSGDEAERSIRGGSYTTENLCQARFANRVGRKEKATSFLPTLGFRCAKDL